MTNRAIMQLTTRLTGVTFEGRQEKLAALRQQGNLASHELRHKNNYQNYEGIAIFKGSDNLGWIPKEISVGLLLPELQASSIRVEWIGLTEIVGGTAEKENYGAEIVMRLSGNAHVLEILAESIEDLRRKATAANVQDFGLKNISELGKSQARKVKNTSVNEKNKLYIGGYLQMSPNVVKRVLREYGIFEGQYTIDNDYYCLKNNDGLSGQFKYLFFGPMPHSGKLMGEENSMIAHYEKSSNFIVKQIRNENGHLKFTASGLRNALEDLVIA